MANRNLRGNKKYKTDLCDKFEKGSYCPYGAKCLFAHGVTELRCRPEGRRSGAQPRRYTDSVAEPAVVLDRLCRPVDVLAAPGTIDGLPILFVSGSDQLLGCIRVPADRCSTRPTYAVVE